MADTNAVIKGVVVPIAAVLVVGIAAVAVAYNFFYLPQVEQLRQVSDNRKQRESVLATREKEMKHYKESEDDWKKTLGRRAELEGYFLPADMKEARSEVEKIINEIRNRAVELRNQYNSAVEIKEARIEDMPDDAEGRKIIRLRVDFIAPVEAATELTNIIECQPGVAKGRDKPFLTQGARMKVTSDPGKGNVHAWDLQHYFPLQMPIDSNPPAAPATGPAAKPPAPAGAK